jgi:pre-mRNA-splicing factor SYF1
MDDLLPDTQDLLYEEELARNPFNLKMWIRYIQARAEASPKRRYLLYERAVRALPGSYKVSNWPWQLQQRPDCNPT